MPKYDFSLSVPVMNAAGFLGFAPEWRGAVDLTRLGAFITNPISLKTRTPAHGVRYLTFAGGLLLHTGYPNPGLSQVIRRYASVWARSPLPIVVHLLAENVAEVAIMVRRLESVEGVMAIELSIPPDSDIQLTQAMVQAAAGELPLIVRLPLERAVELAEAIGRGGEAGSGRHGEEAIGREDDAADRPIAFSLGPPRGALPDQDGKLVHGRLYGPAIFPLALQAATALAKLGRPIFGAGGVYSPQDIQTMLAAGAAAVQLDAALWLGLTPSRAAPSP